MYAIKLSIKEAKARAASWGYVLTKQDGEFEAYPKGQRGDASIFEAGEDALTSILQTVRADAVARFAIAVRNVAHPQFHQHHRDALIAWHERHGAQWKDALYRAWYTGNYGFAFANRAENVDGNLQQLRNTCGYEVLDLIK